MTLEVERTGEHRFTGRNERGAEVPIGRKGTEGAFSPGELLQIAVAGCATVTAESLILRRLGADATVRARVTAEANDAEHRIDGVDVAFDLDLSGLDENARAELIATVDRAVERLCTVSRTLKRGAPVRESF